MKCTVEELYSRMSHDEFLEWVAFYRINPWGAEIEDVKNSLVCSTIANSALMTVDSKKLKNSPFKPDMFRVVNTSEIRKNEKKELADKVSSRLFEIMKERKFKKNGN